MFLDAFFRRHGYLVNRMKEKEMMDTSEKDARGTWDVSACHGEQQHGEYGVGKLWAIVG